MKVAYPSNKDTSLIEDTSVESQVKRGHVSNMAVYVSLLVAAVSSLKRLYCLRTDVECHSREVVPVQLTCV